VTGRASRGVAGIGAALFLAILGTGLLSAAGDPPARTIGNAGSTSSWAPGSPLSGASGPVPGSMSSIASAEAGRGDEGAVSGRIAVSPIIVRLVAVPARPKSKGPVQVRASVSNLSSKKVALITVSVRVTPTGLQLQPSGAKVIRSLPAGRAVDGTWTLCSTTGGMFRLIAVAMTGGTSTASTPILIAVPRSARC
jgi:hypothetical protein